MGIAIQINPVETFRDDFTFANSPKAIRRFPFPFPEDRYMYSVNIEPHTRGASGSGWSFRRLATAIRSL